jgi:hypothetical protein
LPLGDAVGSADEDEDDEDRHDEPAVVRGPDE